MAKKMFPKEVYVIRIDNHNETFFAVVDKLDEIDQEQVVAVYRLAETKQLKIARSLT